MTTTQSRSRSTVLHYSGAHALQDQVVTMGIPLVKTANPSSGPRVAWYDKKAAKRRDQNRTPVVASASMLLINSSCKEDTTCYCILYSGESAFVIPIWFG